MRHLQLKEYSSLVLGLLGWVIPNPTVSLKSPKENHLEFAGAKRQ